MARVSPTHSANSETLSLFECQAVAGILDRPRIHIEHPYRVAAFYPRTSQDTGVYKNKEEKNDPLLLPVCPDLRIPLCQKTRGVIHPDTPCGSCSQQGW